MHQISNHTNLQPMKKISMLQKMGSANTKFHTTVVYNINCILKRTYRFIMYSSIFRSKHQNEGRKCIAFHNLRSHDAIWFNDVQLQISNFLMKERPNLILVFIVFKCQGSQRPSGSSLHLCISEFKQFNKRRNPTFHPVYTYIHSIWS